MNCNCGADMTGNGHSPGCALIEQIVQDIRNGKSEVMSVRYARDHEPTIIIKVNPTGMDVNFHNCHGLNPDGTVPNHQPEMHDWK